MAPEDLYATIIFFLVLYLVTDLMCSWVLKVVPSLVGYILVRIAFEPGEFDLFGLGISNCAVQTFVILGKLELVVLMEQARLEMGYKALRIVGLRGVIIAFAGAILPVTIGTAIASGGQLEVVTFNGVFFEPTLAGIAMNALEQCRALPPPPTQSSSLPNT